MLINLQMNNLGQVFFWSQLEHTSHFKVFYLFCPLHWNLPFSPWALKHTHTFIHTHSHSHSHTHTHTHIHKHTHIHSFTHTSTLTNTNTLAHSHTYKFPHPVIWKSCEPSLTFYFPFYSSFQGRQLETMNVGERVKWKKHKTQNLKALV